VQVLNVARGGTLIQDIASQVPGALPHKREGTDQPFTLAHEVWLDAGSLVETLMRENRDDLEACHVNSRHHQAIKAAGEGLVAVATAPDGIIEAVEDTAHRFCLGVQWHPENFYRTGEFRVLFEGFVRASTP
jgi:putative glutamine amidotransferase